MVATGLGLTQDDSAAKIANGLHEHRERLLAIAYLSIVYAAMFLIYLCSLYNLLRGDTDRPRILASLVLVGGVLFVALHAVSDIGITGLLGAKLASNGSQHDQGVAYTLYLVTFAHGFWFRPEAATGGRRVDAAALPGIASARLGAVRVLALDDLRSSESASPADTRFTCASSSTC